MNRIALIIGNMGSPKDHNEVESFLYGIFTDKSIINLPNFLRKKIAKKIVSKRIKYSQKMYEQIEGYSKVLEETSKQSSIINSKLKEMLTPEQKNIDIKTFVSMKYTSPRATDIIKNLEEYDPDTILIVPMYPHYNKSTSQTFIDEYKILLKKNEQLKSKKLLYIKDFYNNKGLINYYTQQIESKLQENKKNIILFSAHSLPKKFLGGNPTKYKNQVTYTTNSILSNINHNSKISYEYSICYQSAPLKFGWLKPFLSDLIEEYSKIENTNIIIVPVSFVTENLETLYELDIKYKKKALKYSCCDYNRIKTVSLHHEFLYYIVDDIYKKLF